MSRASHEIAILRWVEAALPGLTVVFMPFNGPRPSLPYVGIQNLTDVPRGFPSVTQTDEESEGKCVAEIQGPRRGTFSVHIYADNNVDLAEQLELSVFDPALDELCSNERLVILPMDGVQQRTSKRQVSFETLSVVDFQFHRQGFRASASPVIETVEVQHNG